MIIGIDPGLTRCGYAVFSTAEGVAEVGVFSTDPQDPQEVRLLQQFDELSMLFDNYSSAQKVVIERPFLTKSNPDTGFGTAQVAGVAMILAAQRDIPVQLLTPAQVKLAVTGSGTAQKAQIVAALKLRLKINHLPKPYDASDALAIALAGSMQQSVVVDSNFEQTAAQKLWSNALQGKKTERLM
ncbi:crossover junction endodeoxyribonuclease RuvC [Actinomycetota bacterium]|nr:crossover junction endodeoxyribonuclease RuvC [Actinomycetota bacterium]